MRVISVVGARPQFIKVASIARAASKLEVDHRIIHTGQHYDEALSANIFKDLEIAAPQVNLSVGSGSHAYQTSEILARIEVHLEEMKPDWVLVYGDTNSTLGAALASVKLGFRTAHIEAGLRSFDRSMPEEINRIAVDHLSDLLFAPTQIAMQNLQNENLSNRSILVGDVMKDVILWQIGRMDLTNISLPSNIPKSFYFVTLHRVENTDNLIRLTEIVKALELLEYPCVIAAHPRLTKQIKKFGITFDENRLLFIEPPNHSLLLTLVRMSLGVITDSGGLQKEAYILGKICTTIRTTTEWLETLDHNWNVLVPSANLLLDQVNRSVPDKPPSQHFGHGNASEIIFERLLAEPKCPLRNLLQHLQDFKMDLKRDVL